MLPLMYPLSLFLLWCGWDIGEQRRYLGKWGVQRLLLEALPLAAILAAVAPFWPSCLT